MDISDQKTELIQVVVYCYDVLISMLLIAVVPQFSRPLAANDKSKSISVPQVKAVMHRVRRYVFLQLVVDNRFWIAHFLRKTTVTGTPSKPKRDRILLMRNLS